MIEYLLSLSLLIIIVLLLRAVFRKTVSPRVIYALWLAVVIRMLLPVTLFEVDVILPEFLQNHQAEQSERSELPGAEAQTPPDEGIQIPSSDLPQTAPIYPPQNTVPTVPVYPSVTPMIPAVPEETTPAVPIIPETDSPAVSEEQTPDAPENPLRLNWQQIANIIWLIGSAASALWVLITSITYNRRLVRNRTLYRTVRGTKVYISADAGVPCISGVIPSIYITPEAANSKSEMLIIIHEHIHLLHGDQIWAFIRALALIVFWYNPLVWAAATVSKLDAELACDDAISAKLNDASRLKYAHILLDTIPQKNRYATGLGSAPMKERILMLTKRQKNRWFCLLLALALAVGAVGCSFIGAHKITMDNIHEQNGFTILSQETKKVTLILPLEQLPSYEDIVSAEGTRLELEDIPVFTTDTTEVFLHTAGVSGHKPEGVDKDKFYLGFDIRHNLKDSGTVYTVHRVMNENGSNTYSPEVSVTKETLQMYDRKILHMGSGPVDNFYLNIDADLYTTLQDNLNIGITLNEIVYGRGSEVKTYGSWKGETQPEDSSSSDSFEIPEITLTPVDALPKGAAEALFQASPIGWDPTFLVFEDGMNFYLRRYYGLDPEESCYKSTLTLPEGFSDGHLIYASRGGGSGEVDLLVKADRNGEEVYLRYCFNCSDYDALVTPPRAAIVVPENEVPYLLEAISSSEQKKPPQGPLVGYVADKDTPWIQLYTGKNGTHVGRIPYEIFHDWVATDRNREGWQPGWEPEYVHFYYAEFGDFRWAAAHLTDTVLGSGRKNVATSTDGGKTWNVGSTADDYGGNHVVGMYFVSEKVAFMCFDPNNARELLDGPEISQTTDGGKTWKRLVVSVPDVLKGKKLLAGTPVHEGNVIRCPIWHNPAHGAIEGDTMYLVSHDNGLTWSWDSYSLPAEATQYVVDIPMEDQRDFITVAGVYGKDAEPNYPDGAVIHAGKDGTLYYVMGVGNDWWSRGNFKTLRTYRVTSKSGFLESVEEVETFTKDKVLKNGKPYTGDLDGLFTCQAYRFIQGNFNYDFWSHSVYIQIDGTIYANAGMVGTGGPISYEGTYQYDAKTGAFTAKLTGRYASEGNVSIYPESEVKGKLYEFGGFVHFVCESSGVSTLTVNDPLPLTFVPNTDGYATPADVVLDNVFDGVWEGSFTDERGGHSYRLSIVTETAQIQFDDGIGDRTDVSRYVGTYTVNPLQYSETAQLHSLYASAKEKEFTIKFTLGYSRGTDGTFLYFDVIACDAPSLQHLVGQTLVMRQVSDNTGKSVAVDTTQGIHQSILTNQSSFYDSSSKKEMLLTDWQKNTGYAVSKYSVVDLDSDANPEMVLWLTRDSNEYVGFLILHTEAEKTYAHLLYYRQFTALKEDGTFGFSGGVANHGIGRIVFSGSTYTIIKTAYCESEDNQNVSCFIENKSVSKETFDAYKAVQSAKPDAVWAIPAVNSETTLIPVLGEAAEAGEVSQILSEKVIDGVRYLVYRKADMQTFTAWEKDGSIIRMNELTQGQYENFRVIDILKVTDVLGRDAVKIIHGGTHPEATYYFLTDGIPDVYCEAYGAVSEISLEDSGTQSILASWMGSASVIRLSGGLPVQTTVNPAAMLNGRWIVYDAESGLFQISRSEAGKTVSDFCRLIGDSYVPVGE